MFNYEFSILIILMCGNACFCFYKEREKIETDFINFTTTKVRMRKCCF